MNTKLSNIMWDNGLDKDVQSVILDFLMPSQNEVKKNYIKCLDEIIHPLDEYFIKSEEHKCIICKDYAIARYTILDKTLNNEHEVKLCVNHSIFFEFAVRQANEHKNYKRIMDFIDKFMNPNEV
jgi:hypothetical protein